MRVALVYDRLNKVGGAEQVLIAFRELYPSADWYTSVWDPSIATFSLNWKVHTSWVNRISLIRAHHEWFPYLMPFIFESFDFSRYDLVISIGSAESKGIITRPGTIHLNYCLTPTRYLYSHNQEYLTNKLFRFIGKYLKAWDLVASTRPDKMIAISTQVKIRIKKYYNRDSEIIFPPVDTHQFIPSGKPGNRDSGKFADYFLVVSRLVPYKKIDIIIKAANQAGKKLLIIGIGTELKKLQHIAGETVTFLGFVKDSELPKYYQNCLAFIQANEEDFGIGMCEALASGRPVIAYAKGGSLDIINSPKVGILVKHNTATEFAKVMREFDTMSFVSAECIKVAARFDKVIWKKNIKERIDRLWRQNQR